MKILVIAVLLFVSQASYACEYLYGTWQSVMEDSYEHASKNPDIRPEQLDFIEYAFGHMIITFTEDALEFHETQEIEVIIEGKSYPFYFEKGKSDAYYKTCTEDFIEVKYEYLGVKKTYQYTVVNENLYWVKLESEIGREYFRRIQ